MKRFNKNWMVGVIFFLLVVNGFIIYQTVIKQELDLWVSDVTSQELETGYKYQVTLKSTEPVQTASSLQLIYEDGSQEVLSGVVMDQKSKKLEVSSNQRLEHLHLQAAPEIGEIDQANNHYNTDLWSRDLYLLSSYSVPDYDYLTDDAGRTWIASTGKKENDKYPVAYMTVLDEEGRFLLKEKQVSLSGVYSGKPMLRQTTDGKIHLIWTTFLEKQDLIYHTSFAVEGGEVVQGSIEEGSDANLSLSWPVFLQNNPESDLILVQTTDQTKAGFDLYQLNEAGQMVKVQTLRNLVGQDQSVEQVDEEELKKYGITLEEWKLYNQKEVEVDYFEAWTFKDLIFMQDHEGNYLIVWSEKYSRSEQIYFCKLDPEFNVVVPRKMIYDPLTLYLDLDLTIKPQGDRLVFFWSEINNAIQKQNQLAYAIYNTDGELVGERQTLTGPYPWPIQHLTVDQDEMGNFNLVWSDIRSSSSIRPNRELAFQKMSPDLEVMTPYYNLTQNLTDQLRPSLQVGNGYKSLIWLDYKDKQYQMFYSSSNPTLVQALNTRFKWRDLADRAIHWGELLFLSFGAQLFLIVSLNSFPVLGFMSVLILSTFSWMQDHWKNWVAVFLVMLSLKYATLGVFHKSAFLVQEDSYLASTLIFLLVLVAFGLIELLRKNSKYEHKLYLLMAWMFLDAYVQAFLYYSTGLPR